MSSLERSPSPLLLHKQTSELLPDERSPPSSQLTVPMQLGSNSASPSPQMKHKKITAVTEGMRKVFGGGKRNSNSCDVESQESTTSGESSLKETFAKVLYQIKAGKPLPTQPQPQQTQSKRRSRYFDEDGYNSDPGILQEGSEDEPDSAPDPDIERQIANIERKMQKQKELLQQEEELVTKEYHTGDSSQENETGAENRRSKPKISFRLKSSKAEQSRRKIEKYEHQLSLLRSGVSLEPNHNFRRHFEETIRSVGRSVGETTSGMKNRLKGGMMKIRNKPRTDDEEYEGDALSTTSQEVRMIGNDEDSLVGGSTKVDGESTEYVPFAVERESIEKAFQEKLKAQEERLMIKLSGQDALIENQRDTIERLDNQITELIDLQQREVSELQQQLAQIQTHTMEKLQDFDDTIEEYQSQLKKLEVFIHSPEADGQVPPRVQASKWATKLLSALLVILSISLALKTHIFTGFSFVKNKFGGHRKFYLLTIIVIVAYFVYLFLH
ncbi:transmembrane and coiled-coil domain protein 3-like isoform X2 [Dysidea avara]|uniref:transmembrane and coiled-coil domain protein 3-like isoform X2 n=1 Tax=Dysidea avara TaxID=196820 RepID=UPI0033313DF5